MKISTKIIYLLLLFVFSNSILIAQDIFVSNVGEFNYSDVDAWIPAETEPYTPVDWDKSRPTKDFVISENSIIYYNHDSWIAVKNVVVYGKFTVEGNYYNNNGIVVKSGGVLEITGELTGFSYIEVEEGGMLIVKDVLSTGNESANISGNLVVLGNLNIGSGNLNVASTGVIALAGDAINQFSGGEINKDGKIYITNPNLSYNGSGIINPSFFDGGVDDVMNEQSSNSVFIDALGKLGIFETNTSTSINAVSKEFEIKVSSTALLLNFENNSIVEIYSITGEKLSVKNVAAGSSKVALPSNSGLYVVVIKSGGITYVEKIIK